MNLDNNVSDQQLYENNRLLSFTCAKDLEIAINIYQEVTIFDIGWGLNSKQLVFFSSKALEHTTDSGYVEEATRACTA